MQDFHFIIKSWTISDYDTDYECEFENVIVEAPNYEAAEKAVLDYQVRKHPWRSNISIADPITRIVAKGE